MGQRVGCAESALIAFVIILCLILIFGFLLMDTSNLSQVLQLL